MAETFYTIEYRQKGADDSEYWAQWYTPLTGPGRNPPYKQIRDGSVGLIGVITDGKAAELALEYARKIHTPYDWVLLKHTAESIHDLAWQCREKARMHHEYDKVPWSGQIEDKYPLHFVHMSIMEPGMVEFTPDAAKGKLDRKVVMAPGRYLTRFYGETLTGREIEEWAAKAVIEGKKIGFNVTQDADEIERIYRGGPESCMSGKADNFCGHCHPVRVYAGPDLGVAYFGSLDHAKARAVVWPERKIYYCIYGDAVKLRQLLKADGYTEGSLKGARIQRIIDESQHPRGSYLIMPYVDGWSWFVDDGEYLTLNESGSQGHGGTSGHAVCQRWRAEEAERKRREAKRQRELFAQSTTVTATQRVFDTTWATH